MHEIHIISGVMSNDILAAPGLELIFCMQHGTIYTSFSFFYPHCFYGVDLLAIRSIFISAATILVNLSPLNICLKEVNPIKEYTYS